MPSASRVTLVDEQIVADQLALAADEVGQFLPAIHVVFGHAVFDRDDRIARGKIGEIFSLFGPRTGFVLAAINILASLKNSVAAQSSASMTSEPAL